MQPNETLPLSIHTRADVARVRRELQAYAELAQQARVAKRDAPAVEHFSQSLTDVANTHSISLANASERGSLETYLDMIHRTAPVVHIKFAVTPTIRTVEQLLEWFRTAIQGDVLVQTAVDPSIVVGCQVRTTNKVFTIRPNESFDTAQATLAKEVAAL